MTGADSPVSMASERMACPLSKRPSHGSTMLGTRRITSPGCSDDVHTRSNWVKRGGGGDSQKRERGTLCVQVITRERYLWIIPTFQISPWGSGWRGKGRAPLDPPSPHSEPTPDTQPHKRQTQIRRQGVSIVGQYRGHMEIIRHHMK